MKSSYRTQKTKIPGSDLPATYYIILTAKAFLAVLADEAEEASGRIDEFYYDNLIHAYGEILDFMEKHLQLEEKAVEPEQRKMEQAEEALKNVSWAKNKIEKGDIEGALHHLKVAAEELAFAEK